MGAWGAGSFENDTALDCVWELTASADLSPIERAISDVLNCEDYLDADVGCIGLAAAEVVAALSNAPVDDLPAQITEWIQAHKLIPSDSLITGCLTAVDKIRNDDQSELKALWEEDGTPLKEWYSALDDLTSRLRRSHCA